MRLLRLLLVFTSFVFIFVACQQGSKSTGHTHAQHDGVQVDASGADGTWPPQPTDMSKIGIVAGNFRTQSLKRLQKAEIEAAVMRDAAVIAALGSDYTHLDTNIARDKGGNIRPEVTFFSYSNNVTVQASLTRDQRVLHEVMAPEEYQFPEGEEDISRAVPLARAALVEQGFNKATTLNANAMLTYPERDAEKAFHDVRMMYVTVGKGNGATPDYAAWVDLTNDQVVKSGPIESYKGE